MYVRLAFAVAAHLEPEILIVDEVLAVGDAEFQKKCLGKMKDISVNQRRTVLFVSHNLGAIAQLCTKTILLSKGNLIKYDSTNKVVDDYLKKSINQKIDYINSSTHNEIGILLIKTVNELNEVSSDFTHLQPINIIVTLKINSWVNDSELRLVVRDLNGKAIFTSDYLLEKINIKSGEVVLKCKLPSEFLRPGIYNITIATFIPHKRIIEAIEDVISVTIIDVGSKYSAGETTDYGYFFFNTEWEVQEISK
jgi:lipopolysaccharide transport system ATP-binding protein